MERACLVVAALCALSSGSNVSNRFVSFSRGSDSNSGDSPATAWRSLLYASNSVFGQVGGALFLRRGDTWPVTGSVAFGNLSGVQLGAYSDSGALEARPRLVRTESREAAPGATVVIAESTDILLQDWQIEGGEYGVLFEYGQHSTPSGGLFGNITVTGCAFIAVRAPDSTYDPDSPSWWGAAVGLVAAGAAGIIKIGAVMLSHNLVSDSDALYRPYVPWPNTDPCVVSGGLVVDANVCEGCSYNALFLDMLDGPATITRNVFLRDTPQRDFRGGTTDIIIGELNALSSIVDNEVTARGEYAGAPDGCGVDFETNATGTLFARNYISRSWGAGVMVLGHAAGSNTGLRLLNNTLIRNSCGGQTSPDRGQLAFMSPGSSGVIAGNVIATCAGVPIFQDGGDMGMRGWTVAGNAIDGTNVTLSVAAAPVVVASPTPDGGAVVTAAAAFGTSLVFTLDGSRPESTSQAFPASGRFVLSAGFPATAVLVKAFTDTPPPPGSLNVESETAGGIVWPPTSPLPPASTWQ